VAAPARHLGRSGVELSITDTGTGIPRAVLPRIFDPFFTTKPVGQGTGIGLSLTRQIVEGHGGRMEVRTADGVGTTMRLWLPLQPEPDLRLTAASEATASEGDENDMESANAANGNSTAGDGVEVMR
jgi:nitrogen-specific signal transduction histidine kinase